MRLLFIVDPPATLKAYKDSSVVMMQAAQARGHEVWVMDAASLSAQWPLAAGTQPILEGLQPVRLRGAAGSNPMVAPAKTDALEDWAELGPHQSLPLGAIDAALMRKDPPFDAAFFTATLMLSALERLGLRVFNAPQSLRDHGEKLALLEFPEFAPPGLVSADPARLADAAQRFQKVVYKPLDAMGGSGIFVCERGDPNIPVVIETLTHHGRLPIMAQEYLPAIASGDKRILVFDGEPIDWALARIPPEGASRGNLAAGGRAEVRPLRARDRDIAVAVGARLRGRGLLLLGLDVIGDHLTEINVTSPTGFREIQDQTGDPIGMTFIETLERVLARQP